MHKCNMPSTLYYFYLIPFLKGIMFAYHQHILLFLYQKSQGTQELHMRSNLYYISVLTSFSKLFILPQCYLDSMPLTVFNSRVTKLIKCLGLLLFPFKFDNQLCDLFLFKFIVLRHMYVGYTNKFFCEQLSVNTFSHTFVHFTIVLLTSYDFTSYYIVLLM